MDVLEKMVVPEELRSRGINHIYHRFETLMEWAEWYACYWSWQLFSMTESDFRQTTESDWRRWCQKDERFYLAEDGSVYELAWQGWQEDGSE